MRPNELAPALAFVIGLVCCAEHREQPLGAGVHPVGWVDRDSPSFHAAWLRDNGDDLERCRTCHGADYRGGAVGTTCGGAGCHATSDCGERAGGPEACGTCHGGNPDDPCDPLPPSGAHAKHAVFCDFCHMLPEHVADDGHIDDRGGGPEIMFMGLATQGDAMPMFDRATKTCRDVYCHVSGSPRWDEDDVPLACDACHEAPPASHARFARVTVDADADGTLRCSTCHPVPPGPTHPNGERDLQLPEGCDTCHSDSGSPPPALDGDPDPTRPGAGAHARHLDPAAPNRVAAVLECADCHVVPSEDDVLAPGHIDTDAPADVQLTDGGTWDPDAMKCAVWCHGDAGSPAWTESTSEVECDLCHEAPPANHAPFWREADPVDCSTCHPAPPGPTHLDRQIELELSAGCSTCHGSVRNAAPPNGVDGQPDGSGVGAHQAHLGATLGAPVACETCHTVPSEVRIDGTDGHIDGVPAEVSIAPGPHGEVGTYDPGSQTCTVWCHGGADRLVLPVWSDRSTVFCGSCHDLPPANHLGWDFVPDITQCADCHTVPPSATHVDGRVTPR